VHAVAVDSAVELTSGPLRGLDPAAVEAARAQHGRNELASPDRRGILRTLREILSEPMFLLLLVAAGLYLVMGDRAEGALLGFFALVTIGLVVFQERRSQRALDALRVLAAPQARAWRAGQLVRLPAAQLVPGDMVLLDEGERVPADGLVREGDAIAVDESLLTGESVPVRKVALVDGMPTAAASPGGEDRPAVFAGTLVVRGHATMEVTATGHATQIGRIGSSLATIDPAPTPMAAQLHRLVRLFAVGAVLTSLALASWYGLTRHDRMQGLLAGTAIAMAMLPEEFPMALSIFLALGSWRLARAKVLVRRPAAIDSLGATTMLCLDKTGTLTRNELRVARLQAPNAEAAQAPDATHQALLKTARLASRPESGDPLDKAVFAVGAGTMPDPSSRIREYPIVPGRPLVGQAWREASRVLVAAKGAPEAIAALCRAQRPASTEWLDAAAAMARQGLRVIAVARAECDDAPADLPALEFHFLGLLGLADPLRDDVPAAIAAARRAGIDIAMITGDHAATALAIASQAGIATAAGACEGATLAALDDAALASIVARVRVFARVTPAHKLRLVQAFQAAGHVVAMTGDGVNDAPALKAAHVGIAMGMRGTDVAREAAEIVLLDERVGSIVDGIALGRRVFDNLRRVMAYIVAIHVPIAGAALLPLLMGLPPLLLPVHVVLTEMVIDPMCSLVFEGAPARADLMTRPPSAAGRALVDWGVLARGLVQGGSMLLAVLGIYASALHFGMATDGARALAILGLTAGNVALVAVDAGAGLGWRALLRRDFASFWIVAALAGMTLVLGMWLPAAQALLHFNKPPMIWALAVLAGLAMIALGLARLTSPRAWRAGAQGSKAFERSSLEHRDAV
jgi:P-type Ca2+ transporter type 2C